MSDDTNETTAPKWHEKLSPAGREALAQGFNPRSLSDEDYAEYVKHDKAERESGEDDE